MGSALHWAQTGGAAPDGSRHLGLHPAASKMKGDLSEVVEIRDEYDGAAYRAMYTARLGETIYVLHAFQKKSKRGIATPARDLAVIRTRFKAAKDREKQIAQKGTER